uniref:(northern house mosquito) hypothetical protein n=1 Tax=Culex pipiens TaxID=7175 RepID=A0A8D8J6Z5_CULPI
MGRYNSRNLNSTTVCRHNQFHSSAWHSWKSFDPEVAAGQGRTPAQTGSTCPVRVRSDSDSSNSGGNPCHRLLCWECIPWCCSAAWGGCMPALRMLKEVKFY